MALLAALLVGLPLAAALVAVPLGAAAPRLVPVVAGAGLALSGLLAFGVAGGGPVRVALGGWEPPLGIAFAVDGLAAAFLATTALVMAGALLFARGDFGMADGRETRAGFGFWPLAFLLWGALNAVFLSGDLFNLYVALELLTLAAVALVAIENREGAVLAALRYALFALAGSLAYLLGVVFLYAEHGTLDIALLGASVSGSAPDLVAAGLITAGLAAKTALFPFHAWLPPAHAGAPAAASAMLSGLVPKASFFIMLRLWFDAAPGIEGGGVALILGLLGAAAILYGSVLAILQERLKLMIAYSTVAQLGYLFLVFPLAGGGAEPQPWAAGAWTGAIFHALSHATAKAAMFLAAGLYLRAMGHDRIGDLGGAARMLPMTTFAFGLAAVALMGLPPSGGFTAKYLLLVAAFAGGGVVWALPILLGGLLAAIYLFRPLAAAMGDAPAGQDLRPVRRRDEALPLLLALAAIGLGILSAEPYDLLQIGRPEAAEEGLE
jgi:multicomponent Na+:H+ antiporter subunit D